MQKKTIQKTIRLKMEDWLSSIEDVTLRKDVYKNLLVSGGSIASLFLNEKVNDYDVYIKDMDVLKRLVQYYVNPFNLEVLDGRTVQEIIKEEFNEDLLNDPEYKPARLNNLRSVKPDQIKISAGSGFKPERDEKEEVKPYSVAFISPNAISLTGDLQIVCRFHGNAEQIHKTFDFIHATNYFTMESGLVTNIEALESLLSKQLKYQGSLYPITSVIRSKKFIKRGWNITAGEYLKMAFQISELNLKDPVVIDDQLIGVDIAYFGTLINIMRGKLESDPKFVFTSQYLNSVIDKVFNEDSGEEN